MAKSRGIYKRPGSPYYWITYVGADGKQHFESTKTLSKGRAEALLTQRRMELLEGIIPIKYKRAVLFSVLITDYLEWAKKQRSFRSKRGFVAQLLKEFGDIPLTAFDTKVVEKFQTRKLSEGKKPATVNRHLATLKHMFTKAVEWKMITEDTKKGVKAVKMLLENNKRLRFLSKEECIALISACAAHLRPIVITALHTGMRKSEILNLTWDRVDLSHRLILLDKTKNGERRELHVNGYLNRVLEGLLVDNVDGSRYVFHDKEGRPYQDIKKSFHAACRVAGITDFRFHDLRHTFASQLVMGGTDIVTVKELLGHKSLAMTLRYAHLAPSHRKKALEMLEERVGASASIQE